VLWVSRGYYRVLRELRDYLSEMLIGRCQDCGIHFFTSKSNRRRHDLRCPFGCRISHFRSCSTKRSVEYYRTESGREKKKEINSRRLKARPLNSNSSHKWNFDLLVHLCLILNRLEKRRYSLIEIRQRLDMTLFEDLRQHSLVKPDG
jgi:hypothetical protein